MKKLVLSILMFCGTTVSYAASDHGSHVASAQNQSKENQSSRMNSSDKVSVSKTLTVSNCWIRSLPSPVPSAGYFLIKNTGVNDEKLTDLTIGEFDQVSLHQSTDEGGRSKMSMAYDIFIPAGGELKFRPGGYHAMLEKSNSTIKVGALVEAEFSFESGEQIMTTCVVKPAISS